MHRIYYNNEPGDGPRVIEHGGEEIVWQPKGEIWEKKVFKNQKYRDEWTEKTYTRDEVRWVKTDKIGEPISFKDLTADQLKEAAKAKNNRDGKLIHEKDLNTELTVDDIDAQIKRFTEMKAAAEEKKKPGRPKKNA